LRLWNLKMKMTWRRPSKERTVNQFEVSPCACKSLMLLVVMVVERPLEKASALTAKALVTGLVNVPILVNPTEEEVVVADAPTKTEDDVVAIRIAAIAMETTTTTAMNDRTMVLLVVVVMIEEAVVPTAITLLAAAALKVALLLSFRCSPAYCGVSSSLGLVWS